jgi:hypothetical protein
MYENTGTYFKQFKTYYPNKRMNDVYLWAECFVNEAYLIE